MKRRAQNSVRLIIALAVVAALGLSLFIFSRWLRPVLLVTEVVEGPVVRAFYATGTVSPEREYPIRSNIAGTITEVRVDKGDRVKKGDPIAFVAAPELKFLADKAQAELSECLLKLRRWTRQQGMDRAAELLGQFGLKDKARRRANRLSGGEPQRVAIARALANQPAVLLADEPTGNLGRKNSEVIAEIFQQLSLGRQSIVMVTHDLNLAHRAGRIVTMEDGNIVGDERLNSGHTVVETESTSWRINGRNE